LTNPSFETLATTSRGPNTLYAGSSRGGLFRILDDTPVLSLDSTQYCVGGNWKLQVSNGATDKSIHLLGTSNGKSWEIQDWRKTDRDGNWSEAQRFGEGTGGSHFLRVDVDGALSNVVSYVVSTCRS
jgi:hypothetical protein